MRWVTYQLVIDVAAGVRIEVGRLGIIAFPPGRYIYTGSAKRNIEARIARHLRREKKRHWHIDHLLATSGVHVVDVRRSSRAECAINRATRGEVIAPGFGATDCRSQCGAHLKYLGASLPRTLPDC